MQLSDRLAELRQERGFTLRELRTRIDEVDGSPPSISYLSELERGQATPSLDTLSRLARAYDLSLQDLLAPVDNQEGQTDARYPPSLLEFAHERGLSDAWKEALARVEYRGKRPDSVMEWEAIYGILRAFLDRDSAVNE